MQTARVWLTPLGDAAVTVSCVPVHSRLRLRDNSLIEIGTRRFVFHSAVPDDAEDNNPPSKPVQNPRRPIPWGHSNKTFSPLRELAFASPHPTPGASRRERVDAPATGTSPWGTSPARDAVFRNETSLSLRAKAEEEVDGIRAAAKRDQADHHVQSPTARRSGLSQLQMFYACTKLQHSTISTCAQFHHPTCAVNRGHA